MQMLNLLMLFLFYMTGFVVVEYMESCAGCGYVLEISVVVVLQYSRRVVVEWSYPLTGDAKVVGSIRGTAFMLLSKAFPCTLLLPTHV